MARRCGARTSVRCGSPQGGSSMGKYGDVALRATRMLGAGEARLPLESWSVAAREAFPGKLPAQRKGCPRSAFLGLCEEGLVAGVPRGEFGAGKANKSYAIEAARLLASGEARPEDGPAALWRQVMNGRQKRANSQMDVVLTLWTNRLIARRTR